jgi:ACR3 family arsenite efflux pump ArsB
MSSNKFTKKVIINIYDLSNNNLLYPMGLGFYHTGIQISDTGKKNLFKNFLKNIHFLNLVLLVVFQKLVIFFFFKLKGILNKNLKKKKHHHQYIEKV